MTGAPRVTIFIDVDNTLIDNDAAKREMDRGLEVLAGAGGAARFWELYEIARARQGVVDIPTAIAGFVRERDDRVLAMNLADHFMRFPFAGFLFPSSFAVVAHLRRMGTVVVLSDGDPVYQMAKITRSGLAAAVDGYVVVYPHKEDHVEEITAAFVADHFVLIDDKPGVIERVSERMANPLTTVFVRQGRYAQTVGPGVWSGAGITVDSIGDLCSYDLAAIIAAGRTARRQ